MRWTKLYGSEKWTETQSWLNCCVLYPAEVSFELQSLSAVLGLGSRKPCAPWPAKQPGENRWARNQVHAFFPLEFVHPSLQTSVHCLLACNGLSERWFMFSASANWPGQLLPGVLERVLVLYKMEIEELDFQVPHRQQLGADIGEEMPDGDCSLEEEDVCWIKYKRYVFLLSLLSKWTGTWFFGGFCFLRYLGS